MVIDYFIDDEKLFIIEQNIISEKRLYFTKYW